MQGGDLVKWDKAKVGYFVGVDSFAPHQAFMLYEYVQLCISRFIFVGIWKLAFVFRASLSSQPLPLIDYSNGLIMWRPTLNKAWSVLTRIITVCHYWSNDAYYTTYKN
jgi:hypothetical protein